MLRASRGGILGKIAADLERALRRQAGTGATGRTEARRIASGSGWSVSDVICTSGPRDRPFEEQHVGMSIAVVLAGSFQYRSSLGMSMLTPGSLLLGTPGQYFECGHEHAAGDRCIAFHYAPQFFEEMAHGRRLRASHLPPVPKLSRLAVRAAAGGALGASLAWDELAVELAEAALDLTSSNSALTQPDAAVMRRVTESVRRIEAEPAALWTLTRLAAEARQSPYHYLRVFQQVTGVTPHQFVLRARLRAAALGLVASDAKVIDVALDSGFGDVSNFNAAFRREFGASPRLYRSLGTVSSRNGCGR